MEANVREHFFRLKELLPPSVKAMPEEQQLEYLSELLSHRHTHHRQEEEACSAYLELKQTIREKYLPLYADLYDLDGWELVPSFKSAVESGDEGKMRALLLQETEGVYSFDMLTRRCCQKLLEEVHHFEQWCKTNGIRVNRPNTMNSYGAILDDFGFEPVLNQLMKQYVQPFSSFLYPSVGADLDDHHGFVVEYEIGKDINLGFHVDDSEVTLNVCLGKEFTGGRLFFKGVRCDKHVNTAAKPAEVFELEHKLGKGVFHTGRHRHGALDITSGFRFNLILWCRSSKVRSHCPAHSCQPWCGYHSEKS